MKIIKIKLFILSLLSLEGLLASDQNDFYSKKRKRCEKEDTLVRKDFLNNSFNKRQKTTEPFVMSEFIPFFEKINIFLYQEIYYKSFFLFFVLLSV